MLGPLLFSLFFAPVEDVKKGPRFGLYDVRWRFTAVHCNQSPQWSFSLPYLLKIELCVSDVFTCCTNNGLACNPGKTEVVHFRSFHARTCEPIKMITIGNAAISAMPCCQRPRSTTGSTFVTKKADQQHIQGRLVCYTKNREDTPLICLKKSVRGWYTRSFHQSLTRTIQYFMAYQLPNLINYSAFRMPRLDSSLELLNLII